MSQITISKQRLSRAGTKDQINQYVLDCIDGEGYGKTLETDKEKISFLLETFRKEYCFPQNMQRYGTEQKVFTEWCRGLPSCFNIKFYNHEIIELGKAWGLLKENAKERAEDAFIEAYWSRLYMNVTQIAKKHNVK